MPLFSSGRGVGFDWGSDVAVAVAAVDMADDEDELDALLDPPLLWSCLSPKPNPRPRPRASTTKRATPLPINNKDGLPRGEEADFCACAVAAADPFSCAASL